jgi:hypothetical protein
MSINSWWSRETSLSYLAYNNICHDAYTEIKAIKYFWITQTKMENDMYKIIGAVVVYGFAAFGFATWWKKTYDESNKHQDE